MSIDLRNFDTRQKAESGVDFPLEIEGETVLGDDGKPIAFRIKGLHSPEIAEMFRAARDGKGKSAAEGIAEDIAVCKKATTGWSSNFTLDGEKVKFSAKAAEEIYAIPLFRSFAIDRIMRTRDFMNGSSAKRS